MILFLFRLIKNLLLLLLIDLPMTLAGIVILAIVLPFIPKDVEMLPKCLAWFDNYNGRIHGGYPGGDGLSGDPLYRYTRYMTGHRNLFWERFYWLALRNPANYFSYAVLGHVYTEHAQVTSVEGPQDPEISRGGLRYIEAVDLGKMPWVIPFGGREQDFYPISLYEYYYTKYYSIFGKRFYLRFRMGYKIISIMDVHVGRVVQQVFSFNPFQPDRSE